MISGDNRGAAEAMARRLGLDPAAGEVMAEVLPGDTDKGISVADLFRMGPGDENAVPVAPPVDNRLRNDLERTGFDLLRLAGGAR